MLLLALAGCPMGMDDLMMVDDFAGETAMLPPPLCLPEEEKAPVAAWYTRLHEAMTAGRAGADATHALAFYELPGVSAGPWFYLDHERCTAARTDAPVCAGGVCWTVSCPGDTAAWTLSAANATTDGGTTTTMGDALVGGGTIGMSWSPTKGRLDTTVHADTLTFAGSSLQFALDGTATAMDGRFEILVELPALDRQGPVTLSGADDAVSLFVAGIPVAEWDGSAFADATCLTP